MGTPGFLKIIILKNGFFMDFHSEISFDSFNSKILDRWSSSLHAYFSGFEWLNKSFVIR